MLGTLHETLRHKARSYTAPCLIVTRDDDLLLLYSQRQGLQAWVLCFDDGRVKAVVILAHPSAGKRRPHARHTYASAAGVTTYKVDDDPSVFAHRRLGASANLGHARFIPRYYLW